MTDTRIIRSIRKRLIARQNGLCAYCQCQMSETDGVAPTSATLDHIVPISAGGGDNWGNLCACCYQCNQAKADSFGVVAAPRPKPRRHKRTANNADADIRQDRAARKMAERANLGRRA